MNWDISIDIETLSTKPNALITQIGACLFDRESAVMAPGIFLVNCKYQDYWPNDCPYDMSSQTLSWWLTQSDEARQSLSKPEPEYIGTALLMLTDWIIAQGFESQYKNITQRIWANAPTFDLIILRHAMAIEAIKCPWHFRQEHCMRTICTLAEEKFDTGRIEIDEVDLIAHRADHDAIRQARIISKATRILRA